MVRRGLGLAALLLAVLAPPALGQQARDTAAERRQEEALREEARRRLAERRAAAERVAEGRVEVADTVPAAGAAREAVEAAREAVEGRAGQPRRAAPAPSSDIETFPRDTIIDQLLRLEGYVATEYVGSGVRFARDTGQLVLTGKAEVLREQQRMSADSLLVYDAERGIVCGYGAPVLSEPGAAPVISEQVCFNIERQIGVAMGARTQFTEGATWHVHGDQVYTMGTERLYGANTDFTSCELEVPHYHFTAGEFKYVHGNLMVARNVTLSFGDVPVFWLPFMVQSLKEGRRSGLLTPRFGMNDIARTSQGYQRRLSNLGFYWATSDYMDGQFAMDWFSGNWTALQGQLRYRVRSQFLEGGVHFSHYWRDSGRRDLTLASRHSWRPDERSTVSADLNYASSSDFIRQNTFDPRDLTRDLTSNVSYGRRLDWGSLSVGARRRQSLTEDRVELTGPSISLSLSPVTLYSPAPGAQGWLPDASWQASASFTPTSIRVDDTLPTRQARNTGNWTGSVNSSMNIGRLSWSQSFSAREAVVQARDAVDTIPELAREIQQNADWSTSLNYQQRLVGTSTFTPSLSIRGQTRRDPTDWEFVHAPARVDMRGTLKLDVFGFWPGVGPFSRMRHMMTPNFSYNYSPGVQADERQQRVFGIQEIREQNRLTISLNQVWEAKYTETAEREERTEEGAEARADGEPRRLPQARKIRLLSLNTSAVAYDFVQAREEGSGIINPTISYNMSSDLVQGLNVSLTQDLFQRDAEAPQDLSQRTFDPRITQINANFSINERFVLFRLLRGLRGTDPQVDRHPPEEELPDTAVTAGAHARRDPGAVTMGADRTEPRPAERGRVGAFNASMSYSLQRPRELPGATTQPTASQILRGNMSFQPTENWSVQWSSGYSFTENQFQDHILTLTRDLDCWQANFNFMRAQNGNFSFQFFVELRANRDLKVEYQQRGQAGAREF